MVPINHLAGQSASYILSLFSTPPPFLLILSKLVLIHFRAGYCISKTTHF